MSGYVNIALEQWIVSVRSSISQMSAMDTRHLFERQSLKWESQEDDSTAETGTCYQRKKTAIVRAHLADV